MPVTVPPSPMQTDQNLEFADILILEYAALGPGSAGLKEFLTGLLAYTRNPLPGLKLAEAQQRTQNLMARGFLNSRNQCADEWRYDVVAQAKLSGRAEARSLKRSHRHLLDDPLNAFNSIWLGENHLKKMLARLRYPESLDALAPQFLDHAFSHILPSRLDHLEPPGTLLPFLEQVAEKSDYGHTLLRACHWARYGPQDIEHTSDAVTAACLALAGQDSQAMKIFQSPRQVFPSGLFEIFYALCALRRGKSLEWFRFRWLEPELRLWLKWFESTRLGTSAPRPGKWEVLKGHVGLLLVGGAALWDEDHELFQEVRPALREAGQKAETGGWQHLAQLFTQLAENQPGPIRDFLPSTPGWKRQLDRLLKLSEPKEDAEERLIWRISSSSQGWLAEAYMQKRNKKGWSPGRNLMLQSTPWGLSRQDQVCLEAFRQRDLEKGWRSLVGHSLIFHQDQKVELSLGEAQLQVQRREGRIGLRLHPPGLIQGFALQQLASDRFELVFLPMNLAPLAETLGAGGFSVPEEYEDQLAPLLSRFSGSLAIASDVAVSNQSVEERELHSTLYLRLTPQGLGLRMQAVVRPFGPGSNAYTANEGPARLLISQQGRAVQVVRDLPAEQALLLSIGLEGRGPWSLPDPLSCLELLERLANFAPEVLQLEWPDGQPFRLKKPSGALWLKVDTRTDWFEVTGGVELEPGQELKVLQMLEHLSQSQGRFVALSNGEYLALSEEMANRLRALAQLAEPAKGAALRIHPLAAGFLQNLPDLQVDREFQNRLNQIQKLETFQPKLPKTFSGELRTYQLQGYHWLAQRAEWGVGACLADDMGLGKTIQALALLLQRSKQGPALVVAPTSVTYNWMQEALRFAPTLRIWDLREHPRQQLLKKVRAGDLVVCSYGLLVNEIEALEKVEWATVLLDEAQAIKNSNSQRNLAACRLRAASRLATTGTPLENRLDELWALFRFLNPGLLGGQERFRQRFVAPIENGDARARATLRQLVHPFLLRRTKSQVLSELPPRTEITLEVPLSPEESAFYEALRRRAIDQLQKEKTDAMHVLAELTRLRRACCHPGLVDKKFRGPGSKQQTLLALLHELKQGGHRALVFSQFVDHLALLRPALEEQGFAYQYLDGATPARARKEQVERFQAGESDLFLISLKAGGVGLNLTAADYVIHMDPWWNPAVEDQASDRAHRIGQRRPVTVYRLVAQNTVEDKIVALHARKRELAQSLLEGTETPARLDAEAMLRLIREE